MLTQYDAVLYLLQQNLLSEEAIIEGDLEVLDASRRNCNFKLIRKTEASFLLKQGIEPDSIATIAHEAEVYQFFQSHVDRAQFKRYLPHFYRYDPERKVLILELVQDAQSLQEHHTRYGRFSIGRAAVTGRALGTFHRLTKVDGLATPIFSPRAHEPPWVLSMHHPNLEVLRVVSSANLQLIKIIQQYEEFCTLLDVLRQEWREESLIHYDFKWDNCLVFPRSTTARKDGLKIVDWELASLGDPCWDVGSAFADYLSFWLLSIPITGETSPDRFPELARYPLHKMQPAIRSFWQSYVIEMKLDASYEWLLRSTRYGAARLVQTAFEHMQNSTQLTGNIVCFLQLSLNILRRPHEAIVRLLGIPMQEIGHDG